MLIVEQGKIVEFCAEPGEFRWDSSTGPSIFSGDLGGSIKESFKAVCKRKILSRMRFPKTGAKERGRMEMPEMRRVGDRKILSGVR